MIDKKDCVGKRILYTYGWLSVFEGVMQEISPSEDYVKIDNTWYRSYQIEIKEILGCAFLHEEATFLHEEAK